MLVRVGHLWKIPDTDQLSEWAKNEDGGGVIKVECFAISYLKAPSLLDGAIPTGTHLSSSVSFSGCISAGLSDPCTRFVQVLHKACL